MDSKDAANYKNYANEIAKIHTKATRSEAEAYAYTMSWPNLSDEVAGKMLSCTAKAIKNARYRFIAKYPNLKYTTLRKSTIKAPAESAMILPSGGDDKVDFEPLGDDEGETYKKPAGSRIYQAFPTAGFCMCRGKQLTTNTYRKPNQCPLTATNEALEKWATKILERHGFDQNGRKK